ncbi:hypothetical protein DFQ98_07325 [Salmonella enterica subsp. enterica serovar Essen]|nr:hypothetical protein [Salmonella enterica subsp. enterica serovar Essen]
MTTTTHQTIKSIRSEAASKIAAIRAERDAAIEAIRVARAEAVAAKQAEEAAYAAEEAEYQARQEKARAELAVNPIYQAVVAGFIAQNMKPCFSYSEEGDLSSLSTSEKAAFKKDLKRFSKNILFCTIETEAYSLVSFMARITVVIRDETMREEYRQAHMSYFEKNGITLDLPEEQFQFVWDTYVQYCNENNYPIDLVNEYGLGSIFDLEYICDVESSRKEAFIEWAWPMQEAEDKAYEEYLSQEGEE